MTLYGDVIIEVSRKGEVVWEWHQHNSLDINSNYTSSCQRLADGNTMVLEAAGRRVFEVTVEGDIVWEHVGGGNRSYRYPYDYCPQMEDLADPRERPVTPPAEFRLPAGPA